MIKKRHLLPILTLVIMMHIVVHANKIITFFVKPYPRILQPNDATIAKTATKLHRHGKINSYILKHKLTNPAHAGIYATYAGYLALSDNIGQLTFPRKHQAPYIDLVVARTIVPVTMLEKIIHHWEIAPGSDAKMYHIERKEDKETKMYYWQVTEKEVPKNGRIPLRSILLFAKPQNIYVPQGITLGNENPNLILPDIYYKKGFNSAANAIYVLTLRKYFETPTKIFKDRPYGYAQQLATD